MAIFLSLPPFSATLERLELVSKLSDTSVSDYLIRR